MAQTRNTIDQFINMYGAGSGDFQQALEGYRTKWRDPQHTVGNSTNMNSGYADWRYPRTDVSTSPYTMPSEMIFNHPMVFPKDIEDFAVRDLDSSLISERNVFFHRVDENKTMKLTTEEINASIDRAIADLVTMQGKPGKEAVSRIRKAIFDYQKSVS